MPTIIYGQKVPICQLFNSNKPNICYYRISGKLIELDIITNQIMKTYENPIFEKAINISNKTNLLHKIDSKDYIIYSFPYLKELYRVKIPNKTALDKAFLDESKGNILLPDNSDNLILIKADPMQAISKYGFNWSADTVYTGENIVFRALTNIDGCTYEWNFGNGGKFESQTPEISYSYSHTGIYGVTLIITKPDGSKLSFVKDSIITVLQTVKADFEISKLNDEIPLKVQFTDKSTGSNKQWKWDFGDGELSTEQNPVHFYKYSGDFSPKLIVSDGIDNDTIQKFELVIKNSQTPNIEFSKNQFNIEKGDTIFRNANLMSNGINLNWSYEYYKNTQLPGTREYFSIVLADIYDFDINVKKLNSRISTNWSSSYFTKKIIKIDNDKIAIQFNNVGIGLLIYNFVTSHEAYINSTYLSDPESLNGNIDKSIFWVTNHPDKAIVFKTDNEFKVLSILDIPPNGKKYLADTLDNGLNLIIQEQDNSYSYLSISPENTIISEKSFSLDTNITLANIKSVHENLILLYGSYKDAVNKTTYAYFGKYYPQSNILQDTILYSRKHIRKIERVNNSTYAAIGQSRGRQGYLLLDTNLHQIKDIRVENLTGEIKDMIMHDNKVYLFTEKVVSNQTMALGANESYQTTASVLSLPDDIIANVEESPKIFVDKFTHSAYPNPASDVINLKVSSVSNDICSIKLYDLLSVEILYIYDGIIPAGTERNFSIQSNNLAPGAYYYVIRNGSSFGSGQINVMR
jgi:PKD repeat protein